MTKKTIPAPSSRTMVVGLTALSILGALPLVAMAVHGFTTVSPPWVPALFTVASVTLARMLTWAGSHWARVWSERRDIPLAAKPSTLLWDRRALWPTLLVKLTRFLVPVGGTVLMVWLDTWTNFGSPWLVGVGAFILHMAIQAPDTTVAPPGEPAADGA